MATQPKNYPAPKFRSIFHEDLGDKISVTENPGDIWIRVITMALPIGTKVGVFFSKQWGSHDHTIEAVNPGYVDTRIEHHTFKNEVGKKVSAYYNVTLPNDSNSIKSDDAEADVVE